jgi:hypothetical protein
MAKDLTPYSTGTRLNMGTINSTYQVLASDSSKVFMLDGGPYTISLPTTLVEGLEYKFVVRAANPAGDITIDAGSAIIDFVMKDAGGDASNSTAGTAKQYMIFHTECTQGDYINLVTDGTSWYGEAMSSVNDAIDHTAQA